MNLWGSFRSRWTQRRAVRMRAFLLLVVVLQSFVGNKAGEIYVIDNEEGNFTISFNGSHFLYYENEYYYNENTTYDLDYSQYETPATKNFTNAASHFLQGRFPIFFSLLHLLVVLLQDIKM